MVIKSESGTVPNDLIAVVISDKTKQCFSVIKIVTDIIFVVTGALLGGKFGIGTIICALLVVLIAGICMPY
ncbi:hypothetical protein [Ruminococcus sp.]|uniref:hypothetical protein n=1 Tax=Ruminococcus sp. TaxID=41978 RepID=UPI0025DDE12F|nr:hypothetical protein [Ruminococcus sp.]